MVQLKIILDGLFKVMIYQLFEYRLLKMYVYSLSDYIRSMMIMIIVALVITLTVDKFMVN